MSYAARSVQIWAFPNPDFYNKAMNSLASLAGTSDSGFSAVSGPLSRCYVPRTHFA